LYQQHALPQHMLGGRNDCEGWQADIVWFVFDEFHGSPPAFQSQLFTRAQPHDISRLQITGLVDNRAFAFVTLFFQPNIRIGYCVLCYAAHAN
jgi:hypothetical protein